MRQARALPLPNETLYIEEIKFWLKAMQEHTKFIQAGLPAEAADLSEAAGNFTAAFAGLLEKAGNLKSVKQSKDFIERILRVMKEFEGIQRKILAEMFQGKLQGRNFPFFLDHMLREAKCFGAFLARMQEEQGTARAVSHTREIVIWLRFMADHTKLMTHYIDPSECRVSKMAEEFAGLFDSLVMEARDLASMLYCHEGEVRVFRRFLLDIRFDIQRLRDFNRMAEELIRDCRLLGIMSADLAAHMRRETEHCLLKVALLEKEILKHCPDEFQDDADEDVWMSEMPERFENGEETPEKPEEPFEKAPAPEKDSGAFTEKENACLMEEKTENEPLKAAQEPEAAEIPAAQQQEPLRGELNEEPPEAAEAIEAPVISGGQAPEPVEKIEPVYLKPGEQKVAPRNLSSSMPRERCDKTKRTLPRPLGKIKK